MGEITGLTTSQATTKLNEQGLNRIAKPYDVKFLDIVKEEISEPMIILLLIVGVLYTLWGELEDALTIFSVITILVFVEILNEYRAKKSIASLSKLSAPVSRVIRDGKTTEVKTEEIVPGDMILLTTGTRVPADARIINSYSIQADESSLTGESLPLDKEAGNEIYAGTLIISGEGRALVTSTGLNTKLGKISKIAQEIKPPKTPLQLAMKSLSKTLVWVAISFSVVIPLIGVIQGNDLQSMLLTGLALAFAVIPEELPIIITMILGLGSYKLSKENLLIKKIKATEVLGDATVILTDKTGTITENKMRIHTTYSKNKEIEIIKTASAALTELSQTPTDNAIRNKMNELGITQEDNKVLRERSFGDGRKTKSIIRLIKGKLTLVTSGAPEEIIKLVKGNVKQFKTEVDNAAGKGMRVIAIASKALKNNEKNKQFNKLETNMTLTGLIALEDPPRHGVKETITLAKQAGVRTIMVTGDHPETARYIAEQVGIPSGKVITGSELDALSDTELREIIKTTSVFARTMPEHKYRLVNALHANGEIVAVTGDGVNDSLALKGADIGVAMGIKGTDAAKEAADIVLADDNYMTISHGIFEGRKFYDNLKKGVKYYLSVKVALVLVFMIPLILGLALPFAPIQIIILELFMDLAASAGFVSEPAEKTIYYSKPRSKNNKFMDANMIKGILISGTSLFTAVIITYLYAINSGFTLMQSQTYAFSAWIIGHIILAFISRSENEPLYSLGLNTNKLMNYWALAVLAFLILINTVPVINTQLRLAPLNINQLGLIFTITFISISWREIIKIITFKTKKNL